MIQERTKKSVDIKEANTFGEWKKAYISSLMNKERIEQAENLIKACNLNKKERYKARKWLKQFMIDNAQ